MVSSLYLDFFGNSPSTAQKSHRLRVAGYAAIPVVVFTFALITLFGWNPLAASGSSSETGSSKRPTPFPSGGRAPPDALALPGWRNETVWHTMDPGVQLNHWLQRMSNKENGSEVDWARNKTVLLLGDSVLRDWIWRLCDNHLDADRNMVLFGAEDEEEKKEKRELNEKTHSWECVVPETGLRLINGFLYGMTNYNRYATVPPFLSWEWPSGPWGLEDRIPTLIEQYTPYKPDMIVVNSGPWDFKFMFKRDIYERRPVANTIDIEPSELHEYGERLRQCMQWLSAAFPYSKHVFLQLHPLDAYDVYPRWWWSKEMKPGHKPAVDLGVGGPNDENLNNYLPKLFTRRRTSQLSTTYRRVASEEGWDSLDYWKLWEYSEPSEFFRILDAIHPSDSSVAVMLDWMLEKLWRWEVYGA